MVRILLLAIVLVTCPGVFSYHVSPLVHGTSRDVSMFGAMFQWFEAAVEMVFNYFMTPSPKRSGGPSRQDRVTYRNYQVVRIRPSSQEALEDLESLVGEPGLEFWNAPRKNRTTDILVAPDLTDYLKEYLQEQDIEFTVLSSNLESDIKRQNPKFKSGEQVELKSARSHPLTWSRYHRFKDIEVYLDYLANLDPELVTLITIGKSTEGRPLKLVKVSSNKKKIDKPAVWIDAGMHGREWIAPAVSLFILKQLVENYATNKGVVDTVDWYILPVANPDGYEYTHSKDRFWRKNRSKPAKPPDEEQARFFWGGDEESCGGVDLNRNFDFHWGETGATDNPCGPTYGGTRAFSEPETRAIADFLLEQQDRVRAYLTLHSYSQMWLVPWGFTKKLASDYDDLMYLGKRAVEALKKIHGTVYKIGSSPSLLYPTSGSSDDWAKGRAGIKYSYTIELRDKGTYGFLLPASQIIPTGRETFAAVKTIAKHIARQSDDRRNLIV